MDSETMNNPHDLRCTECRLVLIDSQSLQILTVTDAGSRLPRMEISPLTRSAEDLTQAIAQRYNFRTIQLTMFSGAEGLVRYAVHEIIGSHGSVNGSLCFKSLDEIVSGELEDEERVMVLNIISGDASGLGRFARLGWINQLLAKVEGCQDRGSVPIIQHLNQGIDFCLLAMTDAAGKKMWFKAVGEPNTHEYTLMQELTRRFPTYLPRVLMTIPEWNGWVMEDVEGVPLNESDRIHTWEEALTALANMQQDVARDATSLFALGAKDWTCARIGLLSETFFRESERAMQAQTSAKSKPLSSSDLCRLKCDIERALHQFMDSEIPETLLHGDIGHGNIIATCNGPVFLDWAETAVGHPFLSAEHLLADFARLNPASAEEQSVLRHSYSAHWRNYVDFGKLESVTALAPAVAAFGYALMAWDANRHRSDPTLAWPLIRSLLRRTRRELNQMREFVA